jgi:Flp pilus assembly protein TadG
MVQPGEREHTGIAGERRKPRDRLLRRCSARLGALWWARDGLAAVEFGLLAPMLLLIVAASVDLGLAYSAQIKVQQAAQAGAQYALLHGYDSTKITSAVTSATTLSVSANPAPTQQCGCLSGSTVTLSGTPPCLVTCGNGLTPGTYVIVKAQATYTPLIPYATLLSSPTTLTSQAQVRIQ